MEQRKCRRCGHPMTRMLTNDAGRWSACYTCLNCGYETALHRAEPETKPLTLGEVQECCEKGIGYMPLWVEFRNTPDVSRWMPINLQDTVFSSETVSIYLKSIGDKYNVMWRCWHWKPTPEQMTAEKWEE